MGVLNWLLKSLYSISVQSLQSNACRSLLASGSRIVFIVVGEALTRDASLVCVILTWHEQIRVLGLLKDLILRDLALEQRVGSELG